MGLSERFEQAVGYAVKLHSKQLRKGTEIPYISHLFSVMALVMEYGGTEDEQIAGILHDAVEDQGGAQTLREIRARFGNTVAEIVDGCTDTDQDPKPPWRERKEAYIAHVKSANPSVCLVSACDKLHNARCILSDVRRHRAKAFNRFTGGIDGTLWYYRSLTKAFQKRAPKSLVKELDRTVSAIERLVGGAKDDSSAVAESLSDICQRFWSSLLERARGRTDLHAGMAPSLQQHFECRAGVGSRFVYAFGQNGARVELFLKGRQGMNAKEMFDHLHNYKASIESRFGQKLVWQRLPHRTSSRIRFDLNAGSLHDEKDWPKLQDALITLMIRLSNAIKPYLAELES